jgi:hypothetical protein
MSLTEMSQNNTLLSEQIKQLKNYQEILLTTAKAWDNAAIAAGALGNSEESLLYANKRLACKKLIAEVAHMIAVLSVPPIIACLVNDKNLKFSYSKIHKRLSELLNNPDALKNPKKYLGPNWKNVLNFWFYLDTLSKRDKIKISERYWASNSAIDAAKEIIGEEFGNVTWWAAVDVTRWGVFGNATLELIGNVENKVAYDLIMSYKKSSWFRRLTKFLTSWYS